MARAISPFGFAFPPWGQFSETLEGIYQQARPWGQWRILEQLRGEQQGRLTPSPVVLVALAGGGQEADERGLAFESHTRERFKQTLTSLPARFAHCDLLRSRPSAV
jgi:hypothetical protein